MSVPPWRARISTDTHADVDPANLTVANAYGHTSTIHTTSNHPFWSDTRSEWITVAQLKPGEKLHSVDGTTVKVIKVKAWTQTRTMLDLTINQTHTFYVVADGTAVLVHNCKTAQDLSDDANTPERGNSKASRAYQKHMGRPKTTLIKVGGRDARDLSQHLTDDLLTNPRTATQSYTHNVFGPVVDYWLPDIGARWAATGEFIGFLDL